MRHSPHGWRGLPCRWCRRLCRHPRLMAGPYLRYHSPTRHPGAELVIYPGEGRSHLLWTWLGARRRVRIRRVG